MVGAGVGFEPFDYAGPPAPTPETATRSSGSDNCANRSPGRLGGSSGHAPQGRGRGRGGTLVQFGPSTRLSRNWLDSRLGHGDIAVID